MARKRTEQTEAKAREILKQPYAWVVIPDENGGFSGEILEFPGCFAEGDNADETCRNLEDAAIGWLRSQLEKGEAIPPPLTQYEASGKFLLRLPRSLHARASKMAVIEGISLNQFITSAVAERIGAFVATEQIRQAFQVWSQKLQGSFTSTALVVQRHGSMAVGATALVAYDARFGLHSETLTQAESSGPMRLAPLSYRNPVDTLAN